MLMKLMIVKEYSATVCTIQHNDDRYWVNSKLVRAVIMICYKIGKKNTSCLSEKAKAHLVPNNPLYDRKFLLEKILILNYQLFDTVWKFSFLVIFASLVLHKVSFQPSIFPIEDKRSNDSPTYSSSEKSV